MITKTTQMAIAIVRAIATRTPQIDGEPKQLNKLLNQLEATGEHLNCNDPITEAFYTQYGALGRKLGVVNHMTRLYLKEIKLLEL